MIALAPLAALMLTLTPSARLLPDGQEGASHARLLDDSATLQAEQPGSFGWVVGGVVEGAANGALLAMGAAGLFNGGQNDSTSIGAAIGAVTFATAGYFLGEAARNGSHGAQLAIKWIAGLDGAAAVVAIVGVIVVGMGVGAGLSAMGGM